MEWKQFIKKLEYEMTLDAVLSSSYRYITENDAGNGLLFTCKSVVRWEYQKDDDLPIAVVYGCKHSWDWHTDDKKK